MPKSRTPLDVRAFAELRGRIVSRYPNMSKQLQVIGEFALDNPEIMAVETVTRLSERLKTPPSNLVRFAKHLGYRGFSEMKQAFSAYLMFKVRAQDSEGSEVKISSDHLAQGFLQAAQEEIGQLQKRLDVNAFNRAAELLTSVDTIFVAAQHLAYPIAAMFTWSLLEVGRECILLDNTGGFALRQSQLAGPRDASILIGFSPYQPSVVQEGLAHAEHGGTVISITDSPVSPLAALADEVIVVEGMSTGELAPMAGAITVVRALSAEIVKQVKNQGSTAT